MAQRSYAATSSLLIGTFILSCMCATARPAHGFAHLWQVKEVFSNADGSVQFVEMFDSSNNENFIQGTSLQSDSDGETNRYTFPSDIDHTKNTAGHHLLVATPGFAALSGVTPDYTFENGFKLFDQTANEILVYFDASGDFLFSDMGSFPIDGVNSLNATGIASNTPTNFNGDVGHVDLSAPTPNGDFNGDGKVNAADYVLWRKNPASFLPSTYNTWRASFGNPTGSGSGLEGAGTIPEPAAGILLLAALAALPSRLRRQP